MTDQARAELAKGDRTFGELWAVIGRAGGSKFALKSALNKGRERGEVFFDGTVYSSKPPKKAPQKKKPLPVSSGKGKDTKSDGDGRGLLT